MCGHIIRPVPNLTLAVPADLHRRMKRHPEVKWSEVIRRVLAEKIRDLELMDRLSARSELTRKDVADLDHVLKEAVLRRYRGRAEG
jgi:hypothetical protein